MNINLHIERLVLEGLPVEARQGDLLREAVVTELTRLLQANGLAANFQSGGSVPKLNAGSFQLHADKHPLQTGQQIAQAVYGGIGK
ncbi:MAG: hypothetical protein V7641_1274 [Blastocatellia bacterium]